MLFSFQECFVLLYYIKEKMMNISILPEESLPYVDDLSEVDILSDDGSNVRSVSLDKVKRWLGQPREWFCSEELKSTALSIEAEGQKDPVKVVKVRHKKTKEIFYVLVDGERRWRSLHAIKRKTIKIYIDYDIKNVADHFRSALISNFCSAGHTHMEISNSLFRLRENGDSVERIAEMLGKSVAWVYQYMSLQKLILELQNLMHPSIDKNRRLTFHNARQLTNTTESFQRGIFERISEASSILEQNEIISSAINEAPMVLKRARKNRPGDDALKVKRFTERVRVDSISILNIPGKNLRTLVESSSEKEVEVLIERIRTARDNLKTLEERLDSFNKNRI